MYATELIYDDITVLEYFHPNYQALEPQIKINNIAYAYKALGGGSDYCQVNANCPEGDDWDDQKKSTCRIQIVNGFSVGLCSGSMINNTSNNCTPYVLSADHCFSGGSISASSLNQCVFYFNYLTPSCANSSPGSDAITGCSLVSNSGGQEVEIQIFSLLNLIRNQILIHFMRVGIDLIHHLVLVLVYTILPEML